MKSQLYAGQPTHWSVAPGEVVRLHGLVGELSVASGRAWITRDGDLDDYVLQPGERFMLAADDRIVIEAWQRDAPTRLDWQPRRQALLRPVLARDAVDLELALA